MHRDRYIATELSSSEPDLQRYSAVFSRNDDDRIDGMLEWRYRENPRRADSLILLAEDSTSTSDPLDEAGLYTIAGTPLRVGGQVVAAAQSLDTLTDVNHRKQGLGTWLAQDNYRRFAERGGQVVYGFPSVNSRHMMFNKVHWLELNPMPFLIRPLRTGYFLERLGQRLGIGGLAKRIDLRIPVIPSRRPNDFTIAPIGRFDALHDDLWRAFSMGIPVCLERDANYMNWRIDQYPLAHRYRKLGAYRDGVMLAEIIWRIEPKHGGSIGYVMEWLCRPGEARAARSLFAEMMREMRELRVDAILAWNTSSSPNAGLFQRAGFVFMPERIRPIELYWGVRAFDPALEPILADRGSWYISYLDSDTV